MDIQYREIIEDYYRCFRERDRTGLEKILSTDFHHVSSFGEYFDRDKMLGMIWPTVGQSWARSLQIFGGNPEFMVRYQVESSERPPMAMAEYIRFQNERIVEIEVYMGRMLSVQ